MESLFFRVPVDQIGFVRGILDGYDGLALMRSSDPNRGEIEWLVGEGQLEAAQRLAERLRTTAGLQPIARPSDWPFPADA